MRIPRSVAVMALVTAVPFGFAIRATLHHGEPTDDGVPSRVEADDKAREAEAQEVQEARERDDLKRRQREGIEKLFGAAPATLGSLFHGMAVAAPKGTDIPEPIVTSDVIRGELHINVRYEPSLASSKLHIGASNHDLCAAIEDRIDATWHAGIPADNATVWLDPATHQRAVLQTDGSLCAVDFSIYVSAEQWFDLSPTSIVPVWAIGQTSERLLAALEGRGWKLDGTSILWSEPGVGASTDTTRIVAEVDAGRVVAVTAWTSVTPRTTDELEKQLVNVLGPSTDAGTAQTWASRPPVTETFDGGISVRVGRPSDKVVP